MPTAAILPIKTYSRAKQRLAEAVGAPERRELAEAMVGDVLEALGAVAAVDRLVVVTAEALAADAARAVGAELVHDADEAGQSAAAALGVEAALARGADRVLLVPGDCPALAPDELGALLARRGPLPDVVIVPDRHGSGTNALLIAPPAAIEPSFGAGSFARHAARARAAGAAVHVAQVPSLGLDVDTPDDLEALRAALAARRGGAARTRAVLARLLPAAAAAR
jgi:2-phospho-L-lactate/phosphoenolpyruvate guanylyltransferase